MTRLGPWEPDTIDDRLDRMESLAAIRQLAYRYALGLDSRNMAALCDLFPADVRVTRERSGRAALKDWFVGIMKTPRTSVHFVGNHVIDFTDRDNATGIVYTRDQLEHPATGRWDIGEIQYWDRYKRIDGQWYFLHRKFHRVYIVDALTRPAHGAGVNDGTDPLPAGQLPEAHPTWQEFWDDIGCDGTEDQPRA